MVTIRNARPDERAALEALQTTASLANPSDREAILAHPDAIMTELDGLFVTPISGGQGSAVSSCSEQ